MTTSSSSSRELVETSKTELSVGCFPEGSFFIPVCMVLILRHVGMVLSHRR